MRCLLSIILLFSTTAWGESKRIEVHARSQHYWDISEGESLSEIVNELAPANPYLQNKLMREIVALNPNVFPDLDPDRMLANRRLWLPNAPRQTFGPADASTYDVETYQWGSIKKPRIQAIQE